MSFVRILDKGIIDKLKKEDLYIKRLSKDINNGEVFPAIRNNVITFYHKGRKLFSYDKDGFKTNIKFASVSTLFREGEEETYIKEEDLKKVKTIETFTAGYKRIKENCSRYSEVEAVGVSEACRKYSYVKANNDIAVLDVEASLESLGEYGSQDRIDLLLLNKATNILRFYEAKDFSNSEIWSRIGEKPKVIEQISRYKNQVKEKGTNIIKAYNDYIKIVNNLFNLGLNEIENIDPDVYLLIFGFDRDQRSGRYKKFIKDDNSLEGIKGYVIGDVKNLKIENLWKKSKPF